MPHLLKNKGMSLIELMMGLGILGFVMLQIVRETTFMLKYEKRLENSIKMEKIAMDLFTSIGSNVYLYKVSYGLSGMSPDDIFGNDDSRLPLAWNSKNILPVELCNDCFGRLGHVITPLVGYRGLYKLIVRVTYPQMVEGSKDYTFLIKDK